MGKPEGKVGYGRFPIKQRGRGFQKLEPQSCEKNQSPESKYQDQ